MSKPKPTGYTISHFLGAAQITLTKNAWTLASEHKLSDAMVKTLALAKSGYPIADVRSYGALVRRGIYRENPPGYYEQTELGKELCEKMFIVEKL